MAKQVGGDAIETRPGCSPTTFGSLHLDQDQAHCNVILVQSILHFDNDDDCDVNGGYGVTMMMMVVVVVVVVI